MTSDARTEATSRWPLSAYELVRQAFEAGARWQAEQDHVDEPEAMRIAELEAELDGIKSRDAEVGEDESWWIGGAWGDYGEAVVPLRILSYVIDGNLDDRVASIDPGFALTYAEQIERAEEAEANLALIRETLSESPACDKYDEGDAITCGWKWDMQAVRAILDGEA